MPGKAFSGKAEGKGAKVVSPGYLPEDIDFRNGKIQELNGQGMTVVSFLKVEK